MVVDNRRRQGWVMGGAGEVGCGICKCARNIGSESI